MAQSLLYSAPQVQPPAHLLGRIMAAASESPAPSKPAPVPPSQPASQPLERSRGVWQIIQRWSPLAAAAAIVLLVASILLSNGQLNELRAQQAALAARIDEQQTALSIWERRDANRVDLVQSSEQPQPETYVSVVWAPSTQGQTWDVLVYANRLPPLSANRTYQLWFIRGNERMSATLFQVDAQGNGLVSFESQVPLANFELMGVTDEPAGGSPAPTTNPVVLGRL
jgi:anti-sigma-K factor RskA